MESFGRVITGVEEAEPSAHMVDGQLFFGHGRHCRVPVSPAAPSSFMARLGIGAEAKELREAYASFDKHGRVQGVTRSGRVLWTMPRSINKQATGESAPRHRYGWLWGKEGVGDEARRGGKGDGADARNDNRHSQMERDILAGWV